jgi:predicted sulfurtransferase
MQRLCYVSQANFSLPQDRQQLTDILSEARNFNAKNRIQGVLYFADGHFLQCLEGAPAALDGVMQKIRQDPRHQNVQIITMEENTTAIFNTWAMKFISRHHVIKLFFSELGYNSFCPQQLNRVQLNQLLHLMYQIEASDLVA